MGDELFLQAVYASAATEPFTQEHLKNLLAVARKNNQALGITGILLYDAGSFLQVLEGPPDKVVMMLGRIEKDPRHDRVMLLAKRQVAERDFGEWEMGLLDVNAQVFGNAEGLSDFLRGGALDLEKGGRVERFLDGFRDGIWRQFIR